MALNVKKGSDKLLSNQILHKPINDIHEIMGVDCSVWSMEGKCLAIAGMNEDRIKAGVDKFLKEGKDLSGLAQELLEKNPNVVLVSEEVGYGIVPADAFERRYRETVGRICTELAAGSSKVTRVVCGIGMVLKNA